MLLSLVRDLRHGYICSFVMLDISPAIRRVKDDFVHMLLLDHKNINPLVHHGPRVSTIRGSP